MKRVRGILAVLGWLSLGVMVLYFLLPWHTIRRIDLSSGRLQEDVQLFGWTLYQRTPQSEFYDRFGRTLGAGRPEEWWTSRWPGVRIQPNFIAAKIEIGLRDFVRACDEGVVPPAQHAEWARLAWEAMRKGDGVEVRDDDGVTRLATWGGDRVLAELPQRGSGK